MLPVKSRLNVPEESFRDPNLLLEQWMDRKNTIEETLEEERWVEDSIKSFTF